MLKKPYTFNHVKNRLYQIHKIAINSSTELNCYSRSTILNGGWRSIYSPTLYANSSSPILKHNHKLFETKFKISDSFNMSTSRQDSTSAIHNSNGGASGTDSKPKYTKEELKARLSPIQYQVTQLKGTERPGTGEYNKFNKRGSYHCIVCDQELFKSETKFESGCGWPAFFDAADKNRVKFVKDHSLVSASNLLLLAKKADLIRTEVLCANCDAHLGHRFDDGPISKGGKRFCINSASLKFKAAQDSG